MVCLKLGNYISISSFYYFILYSFCLHWKMCTRYSAQWQCTVYINIESIQNTINTNCLSIVYILKNWTLSLLSTKIKRIILCKQKTIEYDIEMSLSNFRNTLSLYLIILRSLRRTKICTFEQWPKNQLCHHLEQH